MPSRRLSAPVFDRPVSGFTLLEVLVAIVILSFGVLGMVGLQAAALQSNKEARYQAAGARLARELGDLMRGNKDLAIVNTVSNPYLVADFRYTAESDLPAAPEDCYASAACSTPTLVGQFQMRDWLTRVKDELPGVRVRVCFDATPYEQSGAREGRPQWGCTNTGGLAVVKMGWSRRNTQGSEMVIGSDAEDARAPPLVVMSVIAGM